MKKQARQPQVRSHRHLVSMVLGVVALTLVTVVIVAAITRGEIPILRAGNSKTTPESKKPDTANRSRHYVTANAAGQTIVLDRQTGQARPLTQEEARTLAEGIKQLVNQSTDGLVQVHQANGMVSMDLQGHFQNVLLAKKEADGSVTQSCVNDLETAASFFEIDPALLGISSRENTSQAGSSRFPVK